MNAEKLSKRDGNYNNNDDGNYNLSYYFKEDPRIKMSKERIKSSQINIRSGFKIKGVIGGKIKEKSREFNFMSTSSVTGDPVKKEKRERKNRIRESKVRRREKERKIKMRESQIRWRNQNRKESISIRSDTISTTGETEGEERDKSERRKSKNESSETKTKKKESKSNTKTVREEKLKEVETKKLKVKEEEV